jgi:hypothetical protein
MLKLLEILLDLPFGHPYHLPAKARLFQKRRSTMTSLSAILAAIETSTEKVKSLEAELAAEKENAKSLVERYRIQSADALKTLGIAETQKQRKPRSPQMVLMSIANRSIRQSVKGGEKNAKTILSAALEAADKTAKKKLGLAEIPAEAKQQIEERVKGLSKK